MENIKLFCIPYSGGMADVYYRWKKALAPEIILFPVELSGHGHRIKEDFYRDISDAVDDLSSQIISNLKDGEKYAIFGHSLGALLAYEVYFALKKKGVHNPVHIFFSGRKAPDEMSEKTEFYKLPEEEFMKHVAIYGGTTENILQNKSLMDIFVPILREDFKMGETYEYVPHKTKITCDMSVINGTRDNSIIGCDLGRWSKHGTKRCFYRKVEGSHFFIMENIDESVFIINDTLGTYL